jgi:hypothetical protein
MDSEVAPPYTSSHTQEYCLVFSFQATNTVASYCGSPLSFLSRETSRRQVAVLQHPLGFEVVRDRLLAHGSLEPPLAGNVVEQRGIDGRLLRHRGLQSIRGMGILRQPSSLRG